MAYEPTPQEIIRLFGRWETSAAQSPNPKVAVGAPLESPNVEEAKALLPRLRGIHEELIENDVDWHGRLVGNRDQTAMGQLWEEWRDDKLGLWGGYMDIWAGSRE